MVDLRPLGLGHALGQPLGLVGRVLHAVVLGEQVLGRFLVAHDRAVVHDFNHHVAFGSVALKAAYLLVFGHFLQFFLFVYIACVAVSVDAVISRTALSD